MLKFGSNPNHYPNPNPNPSQNLTLPPPNPIPNPNPNPNSIPNKVLTGTLEQSLSRASLPMRAGGNLSVVVSIDRSQFASAYEGSVLSMDKLTPHQLEKMQECLAADYVHLQAPAGAGKTFVALNRVLELLYKEREARALFVARNAALCYFVIRWVCRRVRNTL